MLSYPIEEEQHAALDAGRASPAFFPAQPETLQETGLPETLLEDLIFKHLLNRGMLSGRELSEAISIPYKIMQPVLADLKNRMFVAHRTTAAMGDFYYSLTDLGKQTAMLAKEFSAYTAEAPVIFEHYLSSVEAQTIRNERPGMAELRAAYNDIVLHDDVLNTIGPAINSGRGIFLFGQPGNGKTTIAERVRNCYKDDIYIPRALWVEGEIIQLYDPQNHELAETAPDDKMDRRWVKIKRPTVIVGGELTIEALDIKYNELYKICEAPLQMKANGGTFLIDDFGRQRINHKDLLNRWIVPLEKRYDFLLLPNGKKIQVPFDQLIIFSTNLNPQELVDDAFLRRIPYKIEIDSPDEATFREIFAFQARQYNIAYNDAMVTYLIDKHYRNKRDFRACHPRDILSQLINIAAFHRTVVTMNPEQLDIACRNYFAAMACSSEYQHYEAEDGE